MKSSITCSSWRSPIWPWPTRTVASGHELLHVQRLAVDGLDPVVDEEHLAAAPELAQDRLADDVVVGLGDVGADREAVDRRRSR